MKRSLVSFSALLVVVLLAGTALESCQPAPDDAVLVTERLELPDEPYSYQRLMPAHISWGGNIPFEVISDKVDATATLGRVLFYDRKVSFNNSVSCSSCHLPHLGFADGRQFSPGLQTIETKRNAPGFANLAWESEFFWDGRRNDLTEMVLDPVQDHIEMGLSDLQAVTEKLSKFDEYPPLFADAFGSPEITEGRMRTALRTFLQSLVSYETKFDRVEMGEEEYNAQENLGHELFELHCESCHNGGSLGGWSWANIGLDKEYTDQGVGGWLTGASNGAFLIPMLRNVAVTGPYMHDGRFQSLEEVIDHYSEGIEMHDNLDYRLVDFGNGTSGGGQIDFFPVFGNWSEMPDVQPLRMNFTDHEKSALIAFLHTLTDESMMNAPRFQNPWVAAD